MSNTKVTLDVIYCSNSEKSSLEVLGETPGETKGEDEGVVLAGVLALLNDLASRRDL